MPGLCLSSKAEQQVFLCQLVVLYNVEVNKIQRGFRFEPALYSTFPAA